MIIATARSLNEEKNIQQYCEAYQFADKILLADGGSTDKTKKIASSYPKVQIRDFTTKIQLKNGAWRNPDGPHIQFLVDWATAEGGDWIIHQDIDQRPNKFLKIDAKRLLEETTSNFCLVTQIFIYEGNTYFPDLSFMGGEWQQGLWAWRLSLGIKIIDKMPHYEFSFDGEHAFDVNKQRGLLRLLPPYCFMHFGWQNEIQVKQHISYYNDTGLIPGMQHPLLFGGKIKSVESWMVEE